MLSNKYSLYVNIGGGLSSLCMWTDKDTLNVGIINLLDVNDIELMKKVGFSATPKDGIRLAQQTAKYICKQEGGKGAFREFADLILSTKFPNKKNFYLSWTLTLIFIFGGSY